jgi:hypothetical protein
VIDLNAWYSFSPLIAVLVLIAILFYLLWRWRAHEPVSMREAIAADNARTLREAGLVYDVPTFDWRSGEARER